MSAENLSLLPPAAPGLDEPLDMLHACHDRMQAQLSTLERLALWLPQHGSDEQAMRAARAVMRYFDLAAVNHHLDEEEDLFPAMLELVAEEDRPRLEALVARLLGEHAGLVASWAALRHTLSAIAEGQPAQLGAAEVAGFVEGYRTHIRFEDAEVLPWAGALLGEERLGSLSVKMTDRRRMPRA